MTMSVSWGMGWREAEAEDEEYMYWREAEHEGYMYWREAEHEGYMYCSIALEFVVILLRLSVSLGKAHLGRADVTRHRPARPSHAEEKRGTLLASTSDSRVPNCW